MKSIGEKIKEIRQSKGISQTVVATACGIKQSSYANIENGSTTKITIEVGKGISMALDISFNELFEIESANNVEVNKLKELVFESMVELRQNKEHFKMEELIERYGKENVAINGSDELMKYLNAIRDFYFGLNETLINKGFCTLDEIRNYKIKKRIPHHTDNKTEYEVMDEIRNDIKNSAKEKGLDYP